MNIALLGFGEAARAFVSGWRETLPGQELGTLSTFDIKVDSVAERPALADACAGLHVDCASDLRQAFAGRDVVFSVVTADRAREAAIAAADHLGQGTLFFDCNSCSPATKAAASKVLSERGVRYVDVAVMAPVHPARHMTPLLISGPWAESALPFLGRLGMRAEVAGDRIGQASSIKMLRSVMVKGMEALTAECVIAARKAGVEEQVLASLQASQPGIDWKNRSAYNLERMIVHGRRRAAEMREVAATLRELGLPDRMALSTAEWQDQLGRLELDAGEDHVQMRADLILAALGC